MNLDKVIRLELIDNSKCDECHGNGVLANDQRCERCYGQGMLGRTMIFWDEMKKVTVSLQDSDTTLKVFIEDRIAK